jgi:hypothetical protein
LDPWPCLGGTVDPSSGAAAGALILVRPCDANGRPTGEVVAARARTAVGGAFRVCDLRPGRVVVELRAPGTPRLRSEPVLLSVDQPEPHVALPPALGSVLRLRLTRARAPAAAASCAAFEASDAEQALRMHSSAPELLLAGAEASAEGAVELGPLPRGAAVWVVVRQAEGAAQACGPLELDADFIEREFELGP